MELDSKSYPWHPALSGLFSALLLCGTAILFTFPDGRFVPRWMRRLALAIVPYALATSFARYGRCSTPTIGPAGCCLTSGGFPGRRVYALTYRYRRDADAVQKQQIKWFVAGALLIS